MEKYTIVVVCDPTDYDTLCFQAWSFSKYLRKSMIAEILIVQNPTLPNHEHLLRQYGCLRPYIKIVHGTTIAPPETFERRSGWFSQQVLKLLVAKIIKTKKYLVLDTKNILIHPLKPAFLEQDGRPRAFHVDYSKHSSIRWLRHTLDYFKLPDSHIKSFVPTTTPFVLQTALVRELIDYIEHRENTSFVSAFYKYELTEFFLYAGYLITTGQLDYVFDGKECKTIWDSLHTDDYVEKCIEQTEKKQLPFFSVHRRAESLLSEKARDDINSFWQRRLGKITIVRKDY